MVVPVSSWSGPASPPPLQCAVREGEGDADSWGDRFSPSLHCSLRGVHSYGEEGITPPRATPFPSLHGCRGPGCCASPSSGQERVGEDSEDSDDTDGGSSCSMPLAAYHGKVDPTMHCKACFYNTLPPHKCHTLCGLHLCLVCREEEHVDSPQGKCACGAELCEH